MRLKELEIDSQGLLTLDIIDLPKSCVVILSEGKAKLLELPAYAETKITTHQGKVARVKWEEGEVLNLVLKKLFYALSICIIESTVY